MPRRKSPSKEASETIAAGGFFMTILIAGVVLTLYLFTASPPWMDYIKSFFGSHFPQGGRTGSQTEGEVVRFMLVVSLLNACITALLWFLGYKMCQSMVSRPLRRAGSGMLARAGSWVLLIPVTGPAAIFGVLSSLMMVSSGRAQDYPWVLLNLLSPVATIAVLILFFPRPRALDKAFGIIAPDPSERAQEAEEKDLE